MESATGLNQFARNQYSQAGEDGILAELLRRLPERDHWCVEFGAWDGRHYSNTAVLIDEEAYHAVLIEGSPRRFQQLLHNYKQQPQIHCVNKMVGWGTDDALDTILQQTPVPKQFDFLSIDIDGNDYHVWEALRYYTPKVVCIEYNGTIPLAVDFVQARQHDLAQGSSIRALNRLGKAKGYELVAITGVNMIFVQARFFPLFEINDNRIEILAPPLNGVTYLFTGYDGSVHLAGFGRQPWHGFEYKEAKMQLLPRFLRKYPDQYNKVEYLLYTLYLSWQRRTLKPLRNYLKRVKHKILGE